MKKIARRNVNGAPARSFILDALAAQLSQTGCHAGDRLITAQSHILPARRVEPDMAARQPRAVGQAVVRSKRARGAARIDDLRTSGALKLLFPQSRAAHMLQAVFLNTAGGVTGGDRLSFAATAGQDSHLQLTSQAAERLYRAKAEETGCLDVTLAVESGARLDWVPQETIMFDGARTRRQFTVDLASDARFLAVEPLALGRLAMGERVGSGLLHDIWRVRQNGRLIFADNLFLDGDLAGTCAHPALLAGHLATASLLYVGPDAEAQLAPLRAALGLFGGASMLRENLLFARLLAPDAFDLRRPLLPAIRQLSGTDLPKTWML